MMLTDLAIAARKSGLKVVEVSGWKTRGHGSMNSARGILCHHTAGGNDKSDLNVVTYGRPDLPGPLSQIVLGRDGTVYIVAAGKCYHAGLTADPSTQSNSNAIGIEAVHRGVGSWTPVQYNAYVDLVAALTDHYGIPTSSVKGHKEAAVPRGRKPDPNFDMAEFRRKVDSVRGGASAPSVAKASADSGAKASATSARTRGPFPLPRGHWYGPTSADPKNHSGYWAKDRAGIQQIQRVVGVAADGRYGPATKTAVTAWQKRHGLTADGLVGPMTWSKMGANSTY